MNDVVAAFLLVLSGSAALANAQSSNSGATSSSTPSAQSTSATATAAHASPSRPAAATKKPKKVWTNDEISSAGGPDGISVVGNSDAKASRSDLKTSSNSSVRERQIASYRDRLRQLNGQVEATDRKISDLRNFNGNNSSASGGINMNHRYSTTPVEDQVKALEEKKKQLQAQIDAIEDQARKDGVEPGQLR